MTKYIWLNEEIVTTIHAEQLTAHGGLEGCRDKGLLQSALAKPLHLHNYGTPDLSELAASYAYGIARNHPFFDGNKRTAFVVMQLFLRLHGHEVIIDQVQHVIKMLELAAGDLTEEALASWIRQNLHDVTTSQ